MLADALSEPKLGAEPSVAAFESPLPSPSDRNTSKAETQAAVQGIEVTTIGHTIWMARSDGTLKFKHAMYQRIHHDKRTAEHLDYVL
jgi:hypothetical protein